MNATLIRSSGPIALVHSMVFSSLLIAATPAKADFYQPMMNCNHKYDRVVNLDCVNRGGAEGTDPLLGGNVAQTAYPFPINRNRSSVSRF
jgi:hypothetical protein